MINPQLGLMLEIFVFTKKTFEKVGHAHVYISNLNLCLGYLFNIAATMESAKAFSA